MKKVNEYNRSMHTETTTGFRAYRKQTFISPVIEEEYFDEGIRMYRCAEGKIYKADAFDQFFKPEYAPLPVLPQNQKNKRRKNSK
jgi:hypothetical protein